MSAGRRRPPGAVFVKIWVIHEARGWPTASRPPLPLRVCVFCPGSRLEMWEKRCQRTWNGKHLPVGPQSTILHWVAALQSSARLPGLLISVNF